MKDFFYSEKLGLFISKKPLLISSRVLQAADRIGLKLQWDNQGRINRIQFGQAKQLLRELGAEMLDIRGFTTAFSELIEKGQPDLMACLQTEEFSEWLDTCFRHNGTEAFIIENPEGTDIGFDEAPGYAKAIQPYGHPGWFSFDASQISDQGIPQNVHEHKVDVGGPPGNLWKYWSSYNPEFTSAATRGYVLSSGTCSMDYGVPVFARQPNLMVRECRKTLDGFVEPNEHTLALYSLLQEYRNVLVTHPMEDKTAEIDTFFGDFSAKQAVIDNYRSNGTVSDEFERQALEEAITDILGKQIAYLTEKQADTAIRSSFRLATLDGLTSYLTESRQKLRDAIDRKEKIIFVAGHNNPDADAIISAVFEAFRRSLLRDELCLPLVPGKIPKEVEALLGKDMSDLLLGSDHPLFREAEASGLVRWILVDWHEFAYEPFVDAVIDHHILSKVYPYYVAVSHELNWASTLQVYVKILGNGLVIDQRLAQILLAGTLLEAEYQLMQQSMGYMDRMIYRHLLSAANCKDDRELYVTTVRPLLEERDADTLFIRDYKQSHEMMGFAVIKLASFSDGAHALDDSLRDSIIQRAIDNNLASNLPLTVLKFVEYDMSGLEVRYEEIVCVFNDNWHDDGFRDAVMTLIESAYNVYHRGHIPVVRENYAIKVTESKVQIPRLLLAPLLAPLVEEHIKFFFSQKLGKFVARGFYDGSDRPYGESYSTQVHKAPQNFISFMDVKQLLSTYSNVGLLTLSDYWKVYGEAMERRDGHMNGKLRNGKFVEMLDTFILRRQYLFHNPSLEQLQDIEAHASTPVTFMEADPGLIRPLEVDELGLPSQIYSANNYDDPTLWRYWAPDVEKSVASRGHIFLLDQTALDLKILPGEKHKNMGFRPVYGSIPPIKYQIIEQNAWLTLEVLPRTFGVY